jgi:hypothetical protein
MNAKHDIRDLPMAVRQRFRQSVAAAAGRYARDHRSESDPEGSVALAKHVRLTLPAVQAWLRSTSWPNLSTAERVAPLLGVEIPR